MSSYVCPDLFRLGIGWACAACPGPVVLLADRAAPAIDLRMTQPLVVNHTEPMLGTTFCLHASILASYLGLCAYTMPLAWMQQ